MWSFAGVVEWKRVGGLVRHVGFVFFNTWNFKPRWYSTWLGGKVWEGVDPWLQDMKRQLAKMEMNQPRPMKARMKPTLMWTLGWLFKRCSNQSFKFAWVGKQEYLPWYFIRPMFFVANFGWSVAFCLISPEVADITQRCPKNCLVSHIHAHEAESKLGGVQTFEWPLLPKWSTNIWWKYVCSG